jgi:hypothetical protein
MPAVGFEPLNLWLGVECSTIVLVPEGIIGTTSFSHHFSLSMLTVGFEPLILWLGVECSTIVLVPEGIIGTTSFSHHFSLSLLTAGFEPLILWLGVECFATVLAPLVNILPHNFLSLVASSGIWTLDLMTQSKVFYHCASSTGDNLEQRVISSFSLSRCQQRDLNH